MSGLGVGFALAGLGQGLEQGIGNYLAQKRYERELAMQVRSADDAHRASVLGDVVNYGWTPDGAPGVDGSAVAPVDAPASPAPTPLVGTLLGQAASGPAANTPTLSPGSVLGAQRSGLAAPASVTSALVSPSSSPSPSTRVAVPGMGSIDPTNSMFGIRRMLAIADAQKAMGEARHQEMVNAAGPSGIDGTPEHADYVANLEARKALATLPVQMQLEVLRGRISLGNALTQAGVQHGYRTQEITQEGGIRAGLQQNQQGFERGLIVPRARAQAQAAQSTQLFKEGGEVLPGLVRPTRDFLGWAHDELLGSGSASPGVPFGSLPATKPPITASERAALISQGYAPADIDARYSVQVPASGGSW